MSFGLRFWIKY